MRLKEPLQSMKTLNGHIVMHIAMFIVSFNIETSHYDEAYVADETKGGGLHAENEITNELLIFDLVRWGHFVCAVMLMASFIVKNRQEFIASKYFMLIVGISYFMPMLAAMWVLRNIISMHDAVLSAVYWSQVRRWLLLEQNIFCGQITAGILFLFIAYN